jgi:hypothetical protein
LGVLSRWCGGSRVRIGAGSLVGSTDAADRDASSDRPGCDRVEERGRRRSV